MPVRLEADQKIGLLQWDKPPYILPRKSTVSLYKTIPLCRLFFMISKDSQICQKNATPAQLNMLLHCANRMSGPSYSYCLCHEQKQRNIDIFCSLHDPLYLWYHSSYCPNFTQICFVPHLHMSQLESKCTKTLILLRFIHLSISCLQMLLKHASF